MKIDKFRKKKGYTQIDLADRLNVSQQTIAAWETGKSSPTADKLPKLAKVLGCRIDDLF